jgi:hypothetical protein
MAFRKPEDIENRKRKHQITLRGEVAFDEAMGML